MLLQEKHKNILENIFSRFPIEGEVWAYGSRVNGTAHEGSDLDLVIKAREGATLSPYLLLDIKDAIHDSSLPMLIDIFDWQQLPESFQQNILSRHEVLYKFN